MGSYPPQVALTPQTPANQQSASGVGCFHTVWGGIDTGGRRFRPRIVEVANCQLEG